MCCLQGAEPVYHLDIHMQEAFRDPVIDNIQASVIYICIITVLAKQLVSRNGCHLMILNYSIVANNLPFWL
jgi:hypothetical protein